MCQTCRNRQSNVSHTHLKPAANVPQTLSCRDILPRHPPVTSVWDGVRPISDGRVARYRWSPGSMGVSPCLVEVQVQVVRNMIPNPAGTYLIRRALKNDSDPYHECSKRCHERQVMKVFVQGLIWYHGTMVPWHHGTTVIFSQQPLII